MSVLPDPTMASAQEISDVLTFIDNPDGAESDDDEEQTQAINIVVDRAIDLSAHGLMDMLALEKEKVTPGAANSTTTAAAPAPVPKTRVADIDWAAIWSGKAT